MNTPAPPTKPEAGVQPIPSATAVPMDQAGRVLLLKRRTTLSFHGGAWVFPGGRLDANETHEDAAVREAWEEARLELEADALVPLAHWTTPRGRPRRYATWFYLAASDGPFRVDGAEIVDGRWLRPEEALVARDAGALVLPPPTFVTLCWLRGRSRAECQARARRATAPHILPRPQRTSQGVVSLLPGDAGYDSEHVNATGHRHRAQLDRPDWRYECDVLSWMD